MGFLSAIFGDPPTPPNPIVTAGAQTASNMGTAITGSYLNNYNQVTPQGRLTYETTGTYPYTDPLTGQTYNVPRWTATQTPYNEAQNQTNIANDWTHYNAALTGQKSSEDLRKYFEQDFVSSLGAAPGRADPNTLASGDLRYGFGDTGAQQSTFADAGAVTRNYGPADSFSADRGRVEEAMYQRMNPQLKADRERPEQQLADQGLQPGTEAYDRAYDAANRQTADARLAITAKGGEEQQRLMDMAAKQAGFQNAAQQQAYDQAAGRGTFANMAQKDAFTQEASRNQFYNATKAQELAQKKTAFDATNMARDKWLQEQYAMRAQPLQEVSALQSGSQIQQPNFVGGGNSQIANTDIAGIINANFNQSLENYKQNSSNVNNIVGGLFGLASSGVKAAPTSDRRAKKNIARIGSVYAAKRHDEPKKLPIYSYEYRDGHEDSGARRHIGPMAQDVEKIDPSAVTEIGGVKHIKSRKVIGDILRVA
jgi:hypothetical protein